MMLCQGTREPPDWQDEVGYMQTGGPGDLSASIDKRLATLQQHTTHSKP